MINIHYVETRFNNVKRIFTNIFIEKFFIKIDKICIEGKRSNKLFNAINNFYAFNLISNIYYEYYINRFNIFHRRNTILFKIN